MILLIFSLGVTKSYARKIAHTKDAGSVKSAQRVISGNISHTEDSLRNNIKSAVENKNIKEEISGLQRLAYYYSTCGKFLQAESLLKHTLKLSKLPRYTMLGEVPSTCVLLANVYYLQGNYQKAIHTIDSISKSLLKGPSDKKTQMLLLVGNMWLTMPAEYQPEGYKTSIYYLELAAGNALKEKDFSNIAIALNNQGDAYMKLKDWAKCEEKLNQCIKLFKSIPDLYYLQSALNTKGEALYAQGKFNEALSCFKEVRKTRTNQRSFLYGTIKLAETLMRLKKEGDVDPLLTEALDMAKKENRNDLLMQIYKLKCDWYKHQGEYKKAMVYYEQYTLMQDFLEKRNALISLRNLDIKFKTAEGNRKLLERQLFIKRQAQMLDRQSMQILILIFAVLIFIIVLIAIYSRRKHRQKLQLQSSRIELLKATASGEEKERQRIAQELHDGIGGMLAVVNMNLQTAQKDGFKNGHHNEKILKMISEISADVRKAAHNLLPTALEKNDLAHAIKTLCEEVGSGAENITVDLEIEGDIGKIEKAFNITIYRIIQELIQNILKHSHATHIVIVVERNDDSLSISVDDNGEGYDLGMAEKKCLGLRNIRKRVASLGGILKISSELGIGTSVSMLFKYLI